MEPEEVYYDSLKEYGEEERKLDRETISDSQVWRQGKRGWWSTGQQGGYRWSVIIVEKRGIIIGSVQKQIGLGSQSWTRL